MRTVAIILFMILNTVMAIGQEAPKSKEYYLQKSKNQKTTGLILGAAGIGLLTAGIVQGVNEIGMSDSKNSTSVYMLGIGGGCAVAGAVLLISSWNNKSKAADISLHFQDAYLPAGNLVIRKNIPSVRFTIPVGRR